MIKHTDRRQFLSHFAKAAGGALMGSLPLIQARCKGGAPTVPSQEVTINLRFFNHTQGELGLRTYTGMSGGPLSIPIDGLGYSGVDRLRIAVRKAAGQDSMGGFVGFSNTGQINLSYPGGDEDWEGYLMGEEGLAANYAQMDDYYGSISSLRHARNKTWHRQDKDASGPDEPIAEAFRQVNEALAYPWKKYGSYIKTDDQGTSVGYGLVGGLGWPQAPETVSFLDDTIFINPELCATYEDRLKWLIQAIFFFSTWVSAMDRDFVHKKICDQATGNLNAAGRALLAYVYVKDATY